MNKTEMERFAEIGKRHKMCLKGKINEDINSRLPEKPEPVTDWGKYKLIKSGAATIKKNLKVKDLMPRYSSNDINLVDGFNYPERSEDVEYKKAKSDIQSELNSRELAVDLAIGRLVDEVCIGVIDNKTFLDMVDKAASSEW